MCSYRVLPNVKVTPQAADALMQSHCSLHMPNAACPLHPGNLKAHLVVLDDVHLVHPSEELLHAQQTHQDLAV
jgi:hypothetical protein